jgi:hypothetical protein
MSPYMAAISLISPTDSRFAAAGVTSGAATSPTIAKTASIRPVSRRRFMTQHHTRLGTLEGASTSIIRQTAIRTRKSAESAMVEVRAPYPKLSAPRKCIKDCRLFAPNRMTSYRWGVPPSIPGDPAGMPGTANPVAVGRCSRKSSHGGSGRLAVYKFPPRI